MRLKALLDNVIFPKHPAVEPVDIPLTDDVIDGSKSANKSMQSNTICGLLKYIRYDGYYQVYKAIAGGRITVNFSQGAYHLKDDDLGRKRTDISLSSE